MTAISTTTPQVSWAAAHRALLFVLAAVLAVAAAVTVAVVLMTGSDAAPLPGFPSGGEGSCRATLVGAC